MSWKRWVIIALIAGVVAVVGGPFAYIHFFNGDTPTPLTETSNKQSSSSSTASGATEGTWNVASGSLAGYRVNEVLFGQKAEAVGRTSDVTGDMTVKGTTIETAKFTVDMTTVKSDKERRDAQFQGRIMNTAQYPTATFELTRPIAFARAPKVGTSLKRTVTGKLTLHGTTKAVNIELTCARTASGGTVKGSVPVVFADYDIPNPSFGPVSTEDHGVLEFSLNFTHA